MAARDGHRAHRRAGLGQVHRGRASRLVPRSRGSHPGRLLPEDGQGWLRVTAYWNDEVDRQYRIARTSAAQTARNLAEAGFLPILDDIVPPAWVDEWRRELDGLDCRFVVLCPRLDVAQRRDRERAIWSVDETLLAELHAMLEGPHTKGWLVVDNSEGTVDDAVAAVARGLALVTRAC